MDTATHLAVGIGLAGLSHLDPLVSQDTGMAAAVFIGTVAGSQAPDLDTLLRLKSNSLYIRNHRGASHSLPAIIVWTLLITGLAAWITGTYELGRIALWTGLAVCIHVWQDLFNVYGTQALRPFSDRWIAWNIIHIFDPFIFAAHVVAILLWAMRAALPQLIFPVLYAIIVLYYVWRTLAYLFLKSAVKRRDPDHADGDQIFAFPTYKIGVWNIVKRHDDGAFTIGEWAGRKLKWIEHVRSDHHPAIEASKHHPDIQALLQLTNFAYAECKPCSFGYEVRWTDIRYRHRKQYPFVAIVLYDHELHPLDSYVGWLGGRKLERKLRIEPQE